MNDRQQRFSSSPQGWFDLLSLMVRGMLDNAGEEESHAFLQQMGDELASRYPLAAAGTVLALEREMNTMLAQFGWGFVDVQPAQTSLTLTHMALPAANGRLEETCWRAALGAVLTGLYARWLQQQGGGEHVPLFCDITSDDSPLLFRYQQR